MTGLADRFVSPWWRERYAALAVADATRTGDPTEWPELLDCGVTTQTAPAPRFVPDQPSNPALWNTTLAHAAHLETVGVTPDRPVDVIYEFGGGFGSTARIVHRHRLAGIHVVIDHPVMLAVAARWLAFEYPAALDGTVRLVEPDAKILNLWRPDVFLATFSVTECEPAAHDWIMDRDWFDAERVLVALEPDKPLFHPTRRLHDAMLAAGFDERPAPWPGAVYLTRGVP